MTHALFRSARSLTMAASAIATNPLAPWGPLVGAAFGIAEISALSSMFTTPWICHLCARSSAASMAQWSGAVNVAPVYRTSRKRATPLEGESRISIRLCCPSRMAEESIAERTGEARPSKWPCAVSVPSAATSDTSWLSLSARAFSQSSTTLSQTGTAGAAATCLVIKLRSWLRLSMVGFHISEALLLDIPFLAVTAVVMAEWLAIFIGTTASRYVTVVSTALRGASARGVAPC
mmetsp:Transcript_89261/g.230389  ORF Transcript_89261/g.230389 Transcript_89261/m.230389 type:complete len:234 (-) Transcript_89261:44-745(-)